jgi:hypothetical protein
MTEPKVTISMSTQRERFEAAWHIKWPNDEPRIFEQDSKGQYTWPEVRDTFEGFQLGEASALERAAKVCEEAKTPDDWSTTAKFGFETACERNAKNIRALMAQGEI